MSHDEIPLSHVNDCDRPRFTGGLAALYKRVTEWQRRTFPMRDGDHAASLFAHMRRELEEIRAAPHDVAERADMAILMMGAFDRLGIYPVFDEGCGELWLWGSSFSWRDAITEAIGKLSVGGDTLFLRDALCRCTFGIEWLDSEEKFIAAIAAKMDVNEARKWPAPADQVPGQPIEHVREVDSTEEWMKRGFERSVNSTPIVLFDEKPISDAEEGLRRDTERQRAQIFEARGILSAVHTKENLSDAASRVVAERDASIESARCAIAARDRLRDGVLAALFVQTDEDPATAAQRIMAAHREEIATLTIERDALKAEVARLLGAEQMEWSALRAERTEWRADNERLRLERDDVRKVLDAMAHETVAMAAQRVVEHREELINDGSAKLRRAWDALCEAMGISRGAGSAHAVERAGQLRDDSVAYCSLRGRLVDVIGASGDFSDGDLLDLVADRINGPLTESEADLEEQIGQLEGDVSALKAALHVATRGQS